MRWKLFREYMRILDIVWPLIRDVFPARMPGAGRPPKPMRQVISTILYVLCTGCQWKAVFEDKGDRLCNGKTAHRYHMIWSRSDFYLKLNRRLLLIFDRFFGLEVNWLALDGCTYKAPLALQAVGKNPTDRAKNGTKRSMLVDEHGLVLSFVHSCSPCARNGGHFWQTMPLLRYLRKTVSIAKILHNNCSPRSSAPKI